MAKVISVFLENKPGRLKSVAEVIATNNINIRNLNLQDRGDFGIMKVIVDKPEQAHVALTEKGFACALKEVVAIYMEDKPGSFMRVMDVISRHNINVIDAFGFVIESSTSAVFCVEVKDTKATHDILVKEGFHVLEDRELYEY